MNQDLRNPRVTNNLNEAIKIMRDALEGAARAVASRPDPEACRAVLHSLAWGNANAQSSIECALSAIQDQHEVEAEQRRADAEASAQERDGA